MNKSKSSNTASRVFIIYNPTPTATTAGDVPKRSVRIALKTKTKTLENAVYAYIQAIRALGHTRINTRDIADALSLPIEDVDRAINSLKQKGVKAVHG
jgi:hypothetical protein